MSAMRPRPGLSMSVKNLPTILAWAYSDGRPEHQDRPAVVRRPFPRPVAADYPDNVAKWSARIMNPGRVGGEVNCVWPLRIPGRRTSASPIHDETPRLSVRSRPRTFRRPTRRPACDRHPTCSQLEVDSRLHRIIARCYTVIAQPPSPWRLGKCADLLELRVAGRRLRGKETPCSRWTHRCGTTSQI